MRCRVKDWEILVSEEVVGLKERRLRGRVFGHRYHPDGSLITTSLLVKNVGRVVVTQAMFEYELDGPPAPSYVSWCRENGMVLSPDEPVRITERWR